MKFLIIAGEASGDAHAAGVMREMQSIHPDAAFYGIGGSAMLSAGLQCLVHMEQMAFLGFTEVVKHLPFILEVQKKVLALVQQQSISHAILVDYPGFNLSIARKLKKLGVRIIYYISPQIWAWAPWRIKKIKERVDLMLYTFPFEQKVYAETGIDAHFVGHPLAERFDEFIPMDRAAFCQKYGLDAKKQILLLLPGSRKHEIELLYKPGVAALQKIAEKYSMQIVIAAASTIPTAAFESAGLPAGVIVVRGDTWNCLAHAHAGVIKSGTSTIEAALFQLPMTVIYKTSKLTYTIGKLLVRVPYIAMVNILLNSPVVKELIQDAVTIDNISYEIEQLLSDEKRAIQITALAKVRTLLGQGRASEETAKQISRFVYGS